MKHLILALAMTALSTNAFAYDQKHDQKQAKKFDSEIRMLHLRLAVKMSEARVKGYTCDVEAYASGVLEALTKYSSESKKLVAAVKANPVLKKDLGGNFSFKKIVSGFLYQPLSVDQFQKLLIGTEFSSSNGGAYGPSQTLEFKKNGVLIVNYKDFVGDEIVSRSFASTYKVSMSNDKLRVDVDLLAKGGKQTLELHSGQTLTDDALIPVGKEYSEGYVASYPECDA